MKIAVVFSSLLIGASAFGVTTHVNSRVQTSLSAQMTEGEMSATQLEIKEIADKWVSIRHLSREEVVAANVEPEWIAAYDKFHTEYDQDMARMMEVIERIQKAVERPQIQKKTLGQKRRDRWAIQSERIAIREANLKKKSGN